MKNAVKLLMTAGAAACIASGCATKQATYVEAGGPRTIATVGQINIQDFANAADTMVNSMIETVINTGRLKSSSPNEPAILAISRIENRTGTQFDTDLLIKKIRVALSKTTKVATTTIVGLSGPEDPLAKTQADYQDHLKNKNSAGRFDYTLSGKILDLYTRLGNQRQMAYVFQLTLTDAKTGIAVWEDEKTIVKQGTKASVGF